MPRASISKWATTAHRASRYWKGGDKPSYLNDDNYDKDDGDKYIDNDDNADMVRKSKLPAPAVRQKPAQDETFRHLQKIISFVIFVARVSRTNPLFWHWDLIAFQAAIFCAGRVPVLIFPPCLCFLSDYYWRLVILLVLCLVNRYWLIERGSC